VCRKRPWHFCICGKLGELNISPEEVNSHEHDCTNADYFTHMPLNNEQKVTIQEESKIQEIIQDEIVNVSLNLETVNCTVEIESDNEAEYIEYKVNAILSDVETVTGESTVENGAEYAECKVDAILSDIETVARESRVDDSLPLSKYTVSNKYENLNAEFTDHDIIFNKAPESKGLKQSKDLKENGHVCTVCNRSFSRATVLRRHSKVHIPKDQRQTYQCDVCEKQFTDLGYFKTHTKSNCFTTGKEMYECDECDKKFKQKGNFKSHKELHSGILKYPCKQCEKVFVSAASLGNHVHRWHKQHPPCHYCGKVFRGTKELNIHITTVHMGKKSYLCDICGKAFKTRFYLTYHTRMHTGEKPFVCEMCGKGFINKNRMSSHMKKHGPKTEECDECHKTFKTKSILKKHKLLHSGEKPHKCEKCGKAFMWFTSYKLHRNNHKICGIRKGRS